ncbi:MAG: hypothetical protein HWE25_07385 [Alphaproteobacteria bacterium]|nr:hypothetical protein [Alphaproteobacteria bacterium]
MTRLGCSLVLMLLALVLAHTSRASDKLPDFSDVISVRMPEGFRYAGGKGLFNSFTYSYLPEASGMDDWQEKITLLGIGDGGLPDPVLGRVVQLHFMKSMAGACMHSTLDMIDKATTASFKRIDYKFYCQLHQEAQRDTDTRQMFELARVRVMVSKSGTYLFSHHWYSDMNTLMKVYYDDQDAFWARAADKLDHFDVCDLARSTTCWVDRDVVGTDSLQETDDQLRCQNQPETDCNPTAILIFRAKDPTKVVAGAPRGTGLLQLDRHDLKSATLALVLLQAVKKTLDAGAPEFALVVKPSADPNHDVTFADRAKIAAFFNLMGETAVQKDIAESYGSLMLNFHPGQGRTF